MAKTQFVFFSGKGGVGKTTMACASALRYAEQGLKTLIVTTDPASNLADVFERAIGHRVTALGVPNLWGMEIDPDKATEEYRERALAPMRSVMPVDVIKVLEEQFNSPCTTEIASFDRFVDFMAGESSEDSGTPGSYDFVIFDTAPTGHTIRLLELPVDWSKHIEQSAKGGGNTCIGPVASIQENKRKYDEATRLLADPERTTFVFVLRPEETSIYETKRSLDELRTIGVANIEFVVNGILPKEVCEHPFFARRFRAQQAFLARIGEMFPGRQRRMFQRDGEVKGMKALRSIAGDLFAENGTQGSYRLPPIAMTVKNEPSAQSDSRQFAFADPERILELMRPRESTKAVFFTGKGGVGKTTVSCAAAVHLARSGYKTLLLTTDPASHIGAVLHQDVNGTISEVRGVAGLFATIIDQKRVVEEYKRRILDDARARYSEDMLTALAEELESPCTEEMAAFDKFMDYVESEEYEVVVFDTAPTGHTLRLLQLPFDYSDQVGMMVTTNAAGSAAKSETQGRFDRIIDRMKDPERSIFAFVVYPESTPVVEAYRAMLDLREAGIPTQFVVANQILKAEYCTNDYFVRRRAMQQRHLSEIGRLFSLPVIELPLLDADVSGLPMVEVAADALFPALAVR